MFDTIFTVVGFVGAVVIGVGVVMVVARIRLQRVCEPLCFFCARPADEETWCYGCEQYVCMACDIGQPWEEHGIDNHQPDGDV